ncbi:MAG: DUF1343 domain-containing protein [Alphaproteobacteria bacterium]|nr:DUF1343 domain-containing protein [Alphaproteobacteria bacterium]
MRSGLEVLLDERPDDLKGARVALVCNHTAVDRHFRHAIDRLVAAGVTLVRLLGPEHGVRATAQDMEGVDESRDPVTGLPTVSLYGHDAASLRPRPEHLAGVDVVLFDVQDIGARYYTYQATLGYVMEVAGPLGIRVVVLDRPNPINGVDVEGNLVQPGFDSFVGAYPIAVRHGMTVGELARYFVRHLGIDCAVDVVPCDGWRRSMWFEDTGLPWVYPSPNMPTNDTATVYPGMCLFEATTLSEGRGTTRPFHLVGAPWLDPQRLVDLCERGAADAGLQGVAFRPAAFIPGFQKHARTTCRGVEVHVIDRDRLHALALGMVVLEATYKADPVHFGWRAEPYEFVDDVPAIDLLIGNATYREHLEAGEPVAPLLDAWTPELDAFRARRTDVLLYP